MSGKARRMGAALPGYISKDNGANPNMIQYGDKLQGLASVTNMRSGVTHHVKTRAWGNTRDRHRIFCINQLGGVGNVKNSQFAPNADGVMECHNRKNTRDEWDGIYHRSFGDAHLLGSTQVDRGDAHEEHAWNFMLSNDFAVEQLTALNTEYITGVYINGFKAMYLDWETPVPTKKPLPLPPGVCCTVDCDGSYIQNNNASSESCSNEKRLSNFFFPKENTSRKDLYLGFSTLNIISVDQPNADPDTLGGNLEKFGYTADNINVWFCFGGDGPSTPVPRATSGGR